MRRGINIDLRAAIRRFGLEDAHKAELFHGRQALPIRGAHARQSPTPKLKHPERSSVVTA